MDSVVYTYLYTRACNGGQPTAILRLSTHYSMLAFRVSGLASATSHPSSHPLASALAAVSRSSEPPVPSAVARPPSL